MRITYTSVKLKHLHQWTGLSYAVVNHFDRHMEPHNSRFAKIRGARFAPPMGAMPHPTLANLSDSVNHVILTSCSLSSRM